MTRNSQSWKPLSPRCCCYDRCELLYVARVLILIDTNKISWNFYVRLNQLHKLQIGTLQLWIVLRCSIISYPCNSSSLTHWVWYDLTLNLPVKHPLHLLLLATLLQFQTDLGFWQHKNKELLYLYLFLTIYSHRSYFNFSQIWS